MIFQFFCSSFVDTRYDVDGCLNLGPSEIGYHVHLVEYRLALVFYFLLCYTVLTRANQLETVAHGCRIIISVDSPFGLYHVAVVLSFLRSPINLAEILVSHMVPAYTKRALKS